MPDIVLATLNAKFIHTAFGLRYLFANLGALQARAAIAEFDINQRPLDIAEALLARQPRLLGLGVYVWNVTETTEVVTLLKQVQPGLKIILGGPEVSHETAGQAIVALADHVITGEGDLKFAEVCQQLLANEPLPKIIPAEPPDLASLALPYDFYTDADIAHRIVYVEASRGCPFTCEFCLSSLPVPVRAVPLEKFLAAMQTLLDRGLKQFKFVDRTFNLNPAASRAILEFFLARHRPGQFYHFELVPDRLPPELREVIAQFPPGALQFEVGVQTFNPAVGKNIRRRQDYERLAENLTFLRSRTHVHLHADLIIGLPGETMASFGAGFDRLIALAPQEIQVGILKRLRGAPIARHDATEQMIYRTRPPYEILQNRLIDFATMQRLRRFAKYWDLIGNSGNFVATKTLIWDSAAEVVVGQASRLSSSSPFAAFLQLSDWLYTRTGRTDSIALARLMELVFTYLTQERQLDAKLVAEVFWRDCQRAGRRDAPNFLRAFLPAENWQTIRPRDHSLPKRQARHGALD